MKLFTVIAAFVFATSLQVSAQDKTSLNKFMQELESAPPPKDFVVPPGLGSAASADRVAAFWKSEVPQFRITLSGDDSAQIISILSQLDVMLDDGKLRQQCDALLADYRAAAEKQAEQRQAELKNVLNRAGEAARNARKAADLDSIVNELSNLQRNPGDNSNELNATADFVINWQNYLAYEEAQSEDDAKQALRLLINQNRALYLIPRSKLLALLNGQIPSPVPPPPTPTPIPEPEPASSPVSPTPTPVPTPAPLTVYDILKEVRTPVDLAPALDRLLQLSRSQRESHVISPETDSAITYLTSLKRSYDEFKAGVSTRLDLSPPSSAPSVADSLLPVRAAVITMVLPRYLGLPPSMNPAPGEGPLAFLDRVIAEDTARQDYVASARARAVQALLRSGTPLGSDDTSQYSLFLTGYNQEMAGQYSLAVTNYEKALAIPTDIIPPEYFGRHLDAIAKKAPDQFKTGLDNYLVPPSLVAPRAYPTDPRMLMMIQRGIYPPGYPVQTPTPTPPPMLEIPAAASSPSPSPKL